MHIFAEEWDELHGKSLSHHTIKDDELVPKDRPCDWCGRLVDTGYIHQECLKKERLLYESIALD